MSTIKMLSFMFCIVFEISNLLYMLINCTSKHLIIKYNICNFKILKIYCTHCFILKCYL